MTFANRPIIWARYKLHSLHNPHPKLIHNNLQYKPNVNIPETDYSLLPKAIT